MRKPIVINILRNLTDENKENIYQFMFSQLKENRYIKKELGKIFENSANLIAAFDAFFSTQIRLNLMPKINRIKRSAKTLLNYVTKSDDELYHTVDNLLSDLISTIAYFADAYLLARVFKDFNLSEMDEKAYKGATHQPNRAHNIIIYAGDIHADNYRNFLSYVGFTEIDSSGIDLQKPNPHPYAHIPNTPRNCLDMRNIKQPFISYKRYDERSFDVIKKSNRTPATIPYND